MRLRGSTSLITFRLVVQAFRAKNASGQLRASPRLHYPVVQIIQSTHPPSTITSTGFRANDY
jgi:hypothetical protein